MQVFYAVIALALVGGAASDGHMDDGRFRLEAGQCHTECASGYTSPSTMMSHDVCDDTASDHMFSLQGCYPICVVPADTAGYTITGCDTSNGAVRADQCNLGCASGFRQTVSDLLPTATCSSGYGEFTFSGCEAEPTCSLPDTGLEPYNTGDCTQNNIREDQCTVTCATGYGGTAVVTCPSGGGEFGLSGCEFACNNPSPNAGYTGCSNGETAAECEPSCAIDYDGQATDACTEAGGTFAFSGCNALPKCKLGAASTYEGYTPTNCGTPADPVTIDRCDVTCASGWAETASGTDPMDSCVNDGDDFGFSGCTKIPACEMATPQTGYDVSGCSTSAGNKMESQCSVTCDTGNDYTGSPVVTCPADGSQFTLSGCDPIPKCTTTGAVTTGYTLDSCSGTSLKASECTVSCDTGNDYSGSASATCASEGAVMTFDGCLPECTLPTTMPAGYLVGTCTGSAPQRANQCGVICDAATHIGDAMATCTQAGGEFGLSGCSPIPTCTLPSSAAGYLWGGCNPGRTDAYGIGEASCQVQCAPGYGGPGATATATCASAGGTFELSGCMPGHGCELPASTTGYRTELCTLPECGDSGEDQANPIEAGLCQVECAVGYGGMSPSVMCDSTGSFTLSGCHPLCVHPTDTAGYDTTACPTQAGAITEGQCMISCAAGYQIVSGMTPNAQCSTAFGHFVFSGCEPVPECELPTLGDAYSHSDGCGGTRRQDQCTGVTCGTGYAGTAMVTCPSGGGLFTLSGCDPACILPSSNDGYEISACTGQKSEAQCGVTCANWWTGDAMTTCTTAGGQHSFSGCTEEPKCNDPQTTGYSTTNCGGGTTTVYDSQCSVQCATGYTGDAMKTCTGGTFSFTGCALIPKCTAPDSLVGYTFGSGCSGEVYATECTASCASGYAGTPVPTCPSNEGEFTFIGCEPTCTLPALQTGYTWGTCSAQRATTAVSACGVMCAAGYTYTTEITASCPSSGGELTFGGCVAIPTCTLSADSHLGYDVSRCNPGRDSGYGIPASECAVSCAAGYAGDAMATCSATGGTFVFSGCEREPVCTLPASTVGYETSRCTTSIDCSAFHRTADTVHQGVSVAIIALSSVLGAWSIQL